jgi:membrane protease YdiL (CAAX protease family)
MLAWDKESQFGALIGGVSAFVLLVDNKHGVRRDGFLEPAWTMLLYVALPLLAIALYESHKRRKAAMAIGSLGLLLVLIPIVHRAWVEGGRAHYFHNKEQMVYAALLGLGLGLATAKAGSVRLQDWGLGLGDWRWWAPRCGLLLLAVLPMVAIGASMSPELLEFYPEVPYAKESASGLVRYQLGNGVYMMAWEWFFRGFLLFGIARYWGAIPAILLQAYPFMLMHKAKPELEMAASFGGSILLGLFCLRARCFWPAFVLHWFMNIDMEVTGFLNHHELLWFSK